MDREAFDAQLPALRDEFGDRAILRCIHYWHENALVDERWRQLNIGDMQAFLELTRESGASSAMYLQNVVASLGPEQPALYALGLAEHVLKGRGAVRIHGGWLWRHDPGVRPTRARRRVHAQDGRLARRGREPSLSRH